MAKRKTLENPKTKRLARILGVVPGVALGLLETLWHFTGDYKPEGGLTINDLEDAFDSGGWLGMFTSEQIIAALTNGAKECVWLDDLGDGLYYIHDWHEHCEDNINRAVARAHKWFANGAQPKLSRLGKDERPELEAFYAANEAPKRPTFEPVRTECASSAHDMRPTSPLLSSPSLTSPKEEVTTSHQLGSVANEDAHKPSRGRKTRVDPEPPTPASPEIFEDSASPPPEPDEGLTPAEKFDRALNKLGSKFAMPSEGHDPEIEAKKQRMIAEARARQARESA